MLPPSQSAAPKKISHFDTGLSNIVMGVGEFHENSSYLEDQGYLRGLKTVPGYLKEESSIPPTGKSFNRPWMQDWRNHGEGLSLAHGEAPSRVELERRDVIAPKRDEYEKYMVQLAKTAKVPQAKSNARPWQMDSSGIGFCLGPGDVVR
jgi:hypothetical protein